MPIAPLTDRVVLAVTGEEAASFLSGLLTCAVDDAQGARFGALLAPQGKIIADLFLVRRQEGTEKEGTGKAGTGKDGQGGFLLDTPGAVAEALLKRLTLYKLRAKVALADLSAELHAFAAWDTAVAAPPGATSFPDPRLAAMGQRLIAPQAALALLLDASPADYEAHRIGLAMPQGGRDFAYGDAFPHEAAMDQLGGVDFQKGCYVGQEVVSRTQHRGSARTRIAALRFEANAPPEGAEIRAGDKAIGRVGSVDAAQRRAIGLLRLDRLAEAFAASEPLLAGEVAIHAEKPVWARYPFPQPAV
ncbi:MAG: YgfZ/GcvT domain-containing protein [Hyphomicrobiales bacterium]